MAVELEVIFRGMFHLATPPAGGQEDHARILMPRNNSARAAKGNDHYTIAPYKAFVAIPVSAKPSVTPDFEADLDVEHAQNGVRKRERYAIYLTDEYEVIVNALVGQNELQYDSSPVTDRQQPEAGERSVNWLAPLRSPNAAAVAAALLTAIPPATTSYVDLSRGEMRPHGLLNTHSWRYLHATSDRFLRPIAQELLVTSEADDTSAITLRPLATGDGNNVTITFNPTAGDRVIIGSEPLGDILGTARSAKCVEPAYDFEVQYDLAGEDRPNFPVPFCDAQNDDHRSPPGAACGPPIKP